MADKSSAWSFLLERVELDALCGKFDQDTKRAILDLFRSDVSLNDAVFRQLLADELEKHHYFPPPLAQKRKQQRQFKASVIKAKVEHTRRIERCSKAKAMEKLAEREGVTVEALNQALKPSSISGENRRKKYRTRRR